MKPKKQIVREKRKELQAALVLLMDEREFTAKELGERIDVHPNTLSSLKCQGENFSISIEKCDNILNTLHEIYF